ncbi:hypothetical protein QAD02_002951 [Eretmocerus hayati]|uniref:Uncharacterized protein n=1 Tax=Eretmocerus hayati TaxID=131215 RepID=A0ACC2NKR2_9HYME|nr:hypothetical protein QAD02_002951 [Eretmocerus hayati]
MEGSDGSQVEFLYVGIRAKLITLIQQGLHPNLIIYLTINIDGFSPFESSSRKIWPILVKIFSKEDAYEPFTAGAYSGTKKPKNAYEFLFKFVQELIELLRDRILINGTHYVIKIKFFVCDSPARAWLKYWLGHAAIYACGRCEVEGITIDKTTTFPDLDAPNRTDLDFKTFAHPECHHGVSLLSMIDDLEPITHFISDLMHDNCLGNNKRILDNLLGSADQKSNEKVKLSATLKKELKRRTKMINANIPDEFP